MNVQRCLPTSLAPLWSILGLCGLMLGLVAAIKAELLKFPAVYRPLAAR